jgi:RIO kinase 1
MVRKSRKSREEWKIYKNVFDSFTERNLFLLSSQGHFGELESPIALGKEANVFYSHKKDGSLVVIKIYRLENCNFNKMYYYINADPRFTGLENQKRKVIFSWVQREYRNLMLAREKIKVPTPLAFKVNIIVMEFIGDSEPATQLKKATPKNPEAFFKKTIKNIKLLIDAGIIHGDLSDFNILNDDEEPVFIDFSQGTPINAGNASELLERDIKNVLTYFKRIMPVNEEKITKEIMDHFRKKTSEKAEKL